MSIKKKFQIPLMSFIYFLGVFYAPSGFCQNFESSTSIGGISNIKFNLDSKKNPDATQIHYPRLNESEKKNPEYSDSEDTREKNYKSMRKKIKTLEFVYQALNIIDAAQTISCMQRDNCQEQNPIFGKKPSIGKIIAIKSLAGILHYTAYRHGTKNNDRLKYTMTMEFITIGIQGAVVGLNFRSTF